MVWASPHRAISLVQESYSALVLGRFPGSHLVSWTPVFPGAFEVRSQSLQTWSVCLVASPPTAPRWQPGDKRKGDDPTQLVLCTYGANCDFSPGPQIIGRDGVEIFWKKNTTHENMSLEFEASHYIYSVEQFMKQTPEIPDIFPK